MKVKSSLIPLLALFVALAPIAQGKDKKKHGQRGMLESMQSVPCGAKERGLAGLGSVFGSVGVEHVNSHEQLCPQYLLRTDEMDYHIRPMDTKHAAVLPVGHEAEFKIKNDRLFLKVPDGDKKVRSFEVVSMQPVNADSKAESSAYHPSPKEGSKEKEAAAQPLNHPENGNLNGQANSVPPPQR